VLGHVVKIFLFFCAHTDNNRFPFPVGVWLIHAINIASPCNHVKRYFKIVLSSVVFRFSVGEKRLEKKSVWVYKNRVIPQSRAWTLLCIAFAVAVLVGPVYGGCRSFNVDNQYCYDDLIPTPFPISKIAKRKTVHHTSPIETSTVFEHSHPMTHEKKASTGSDLVIKTVPIFKEVVGAVFYDFKEGDFLAGGFTHVLAYKNLVYADIGLISDTETGLATPTVGLSLGLAELAKIYGVYYRLPGKLEVGWFGAYDFREKTSRFGFYAGWEF